MSENTPNPRKDQQDQHSSRQRALRNRIHRKLARHQKAEQEKMDYSSALVFLVLWVGRWPFLLYWGSLWASGLIKPGLAAIPGL